MRRADIATHLTAHGLCQTAATWLRQELVDTRLIGDYPGRADLSKVARYVHVDRHELFEAACRLEELRSGGAGPAGPYGVRRPPRFTG